MTIQEVSNWSRLIDTDTGDTEMGAHVKRLMEDGSGLAFREYHNIEHVRRLYALADEWGLPYNPVLDAAILWHDAIYDGKDDKEERSACAFCEYVTANRTPIRSEEISEVVALIRSTTTHETDGRVSSWLIKLDVADLADDRRRTENMWKILRESMWLYDTSHQNAARAMVIFMNHFEHVMIRNAGRAPPMDQRFWLGIADGCRKQAQDAAIVAEAFERLA